MSFSPLWTFLCRRKLETTEKCRPQPSTSHANAVILVSLQLKTGRFLSVGKTHASRRCGCTYVFAKKKGA